MAFSARFSSAAVFFAVFLLDGSFQVTLEHQQPGEQQCLRDIDLETGVAYTTVWRDNRVIAEPQYAALVKGPNYFAPPAVMFHLRFLFLNVSTVFGGDPAHFSFLVYDDLCEEEQIRPNDTVIGPSFVASYSPYLASLGAAAWDVMTLGSTDASDRTNITTIVLPLQACSGPNQRRVYNQIFQLVLRASGKGEDQLQLTPLSDESSVSSSQVHLFMTVGLLSLFLTFLLLPCFSALLHSVLASRFSPQTLQTAQLSLLSTVSLVAGFFIVYLTLSMIFYYCHFSETVDGALFRDPFFSPMTQCMLFYNLAGLASFLGGVVFSGCRKSHVTCCQVMGKGLLSACTTAAFFHSFFFVLSLFEDPVSTLSNIVSFFTVVVLLFLALFAILEQYRKSRFQGNFILVVLMQMTLSSIYNILIMSFRQITCEDEGGSTATGAYLCLVIAISIACVLLAVAMIIMMADGKNKKKKCKNDPESGNMAQKVSSPVRDGERVSGDVQLVQRGENRATDLAAVAKEMGFIVLIPGVVQAWQGRNKSDEATVAT